MPLNYPAIPDIPYGVAGKEHLDPMKETIEIITGARKKGTDQRNAMPTWQQLLDLGLITEDQIPK